MAVKNVGVRELKAHATEILRQVEYGEEFVVTRRGRPVGRIVPVQPKQADGMGGLRGAFRHWPDLTMEDFEEAKRIWEPRDLDLDA